LSSPATASSRQPRRGQPRSRSGASRRRSGRSQTAPLAIETNIVAPDIPWEPIDPDAAPLPFSTLTLHPQLMQGLKDLGFEGTRPVQGAVIPRALEGGDVVACAETGTGKTLAFALPILQRLMAEQPGFGDPAREPYTRALILAPTRELVVQIEDALVGLTYHSPVSTVPVFGGMPMDPQERALKAGADIVVATPGRLMDHMRHGSTDFVRLQCLVLDEADRMMDMGFWPDVQKIVATLPPDRQTLLFSATMPGEILKLAREVLRTPTYLQVGANRGAARTITHSIEQLARGDKLQWLADFVRHSARGPVLVFVRTKIGADKVAGQLQLKRIRAAALHADRTQQERLKAVEGFRAGKHPVLVATDIAARGLDIEGIAHVVNFEVPDTPETYVHRVGRTGRAGAEGHAITLVSPEEKRAWQALEKRVGLELQ
jgi:ATP-dependent RNA helicase RhlE